MNHLQILFLLVLFPFFLLSTSCQSESPSEANDNSLSNYGFEIVKDIEWAKPKGKSLKMDIYIPQTKKEKYPVLIVFHGGGWLINDNSIMNQMCEYIAQHSEYIVCNVNYRLLGDLGNTVKMNEMIEDAMGAVLWVKENIEEYKGDSSKIILTGDSAGGHLAEMVVIGGQNLESDGFAGSSFGFNPTYLPQGKTAEEVASENGLKVQAVILSYPGIDIYEACIGGMEKSSNIFWLIAGVSPRGIFGNDYNTKDNPEMYKAVSPNYHIPKSSKRNLPPHFCHVGSLDNVVPPSVVSDYVDLLKSKGHYAEFWIHENRPHAYLDSGKNEFLGIEFSKDAPEAIDKMIDFMNRVIN